MSGWLQLWEPLQYMQLRCKTPAASILNFLSEMFLYGSYGPICFFKVSDLHVTYQPVGIGCTGCLYKLNLIFKVWHHAINTWEMKNTSIWMNKWEIPPIWIRNISRFTRTRNKVFQTSCLFFDFSWTYAAWWHLQIALLLLNTVTAATVQHVNHWCSSILRKKNKKKTSFDYGVLLFKDIITSNMGSL